MHKTAIFTQVNGEFKEEKLHNEVIVCLPKKKKFEDHLWWEQILGICRLLVVN